MTERDPSTPTIPPTGRIAAPQEAPGANPVFAGTEDPSGNDPLTDKGRDTGTGGTTGYDDQTTDEKFAEDSNG